MFSGSATLDLNDTSSFETIRTADKQIKTLISRNRNLQRELDTFKMEQRVSESADDTIRQLKAKVISLGSKLRNERDVRVRSEKDARKFQEKLLALSDHIEKLMTHLKVCALDSYRVHTPSGS